MKTRERIYQTAKRLYLENGYEKTPNTMIAKEADVNLGLVTYYFKTKDIIASDMLNNNYETLVIHVMKYLESDDELLQLVTFLCLHFKLTGIDPDYDRFIYEMNKLDLLEQGSRNGNFYKIYQAIVDKNDAISPEEKKRCCEFAVTSSFAFVRALTIKQYEQEFVMTKKELFEFSMEELFYALRLDANPLMRKALINSADNITNRLLEEYPDLKRVKNYLYR